MLGAIIGDITGSLWEFREEKPDFDFELFPKGASITDDTALTLATASAIIDKTNNYRFHYVDMGRRFINEHQEGIIEHNVGFGGMFVDWVKNYEHSPEPYKSWGNGAAMRVSPIGWAYNDHRKVQIEAIKSAKVTHNTEQGIKSAVAVAMSVYIARKGGTKKDIKSYLTDVIGYDLFFQTQILRDSYKFDVSAEGSVPVAMHAFLTSNSFEETIRMAQYIGGDSDTTGAIAGAVAEAFYEIEPELQEEAEAILKTHVPHLAEIYSSFKEKHGFKKSNNFKRWW
ncbi:ADP-ribosylglycohydrolase family protein [Vibrio owensii]|uniref:ADP-ribosylglycohydrolase family protein n=1 Tax=Vibrio harveyi group TaxID=717610 RepID=UPI003CC6030E